LTSVSVPAVNWITPLPVNVAVPLPVQLPLLNLTVAPLAA